MEPMRRGLWGIRPSALRALFERVRAEEDQLAREEQDRLARLEQAISEAGARVAELERSVQFERVTQRQILSEMAHLTDEGLQVVAEARRQLDGERDRWEELLSVREARARALRNHITETEDTLLRLREELETMAGEPVDSEPGLESPVRAIDEGHRSRGG